MTSTIASSFEALKKYDSSNGSDVSDIVFVNGIEL